MLSKGQYGGRPRWTALLAHESVRLACAQSTPLLGFTTNRARSSPEGVTQQVRHPPTRSWGQASPTSSQLPIRQVMG
jgi:hypothetical protein